MRVLVFSTAVHLGSLFFLTFPMAADASRLSNPQSTTEPTVLELPFDGRQDLNGERLCFVSYLPSAGFWLIEVRSLQPKTDHFRLEFPGETHTNTSILHRTLHTALVAVESAGFRGFCVSPSVSDVFGGVWLRSFLAYDLDKSDPDEAEPDPDPEPVPPSQPADTVVTAVGQLCQGFKLVSPESQICAPRLGQGSAIDGHLSRGEIHTYRVVLDRWMTLSVSVRADASLIVDLLGPQGHRLQRWEEVSEARQPATLGPGAYTLRLWAGATGEYSLAWSGEPLP